MLRRTVRTRGRDPHAWTRHRAWGGRRRASTHTSRHPDATDVQLTVAGTVALEPVRSLAATCADLTRDIGATQLSTARWFLDA